MSGSTRAQRRFSRCVVTLDAGVSIAWAPDDDGSYEHGARHHRDEADTFRARLERAGPAIEVLFDALEEAGHVFQSPDAPAFEDAQRQASGMIELSEVALCCRPPLSEVRLAALAERIAGLLREEPV